MLETTLTKDDARINSIEIEKEEYSASYGFEVTTDDDRAFFDLCSAVHQCGVFARKNQALIHRSLKSDGSILTETDLAVSDCLIATIRRLYPDCNIISEEIDLHSYREGARLTFVIDPIDGTDAYSQGMACWCVSVGLLDSKRNPCGGIVFAPRFGVGTEELFLCSAPGDDRVFLNGELHKPLKHYDVPRQITMGSEMLRYARMDNYPGKIRAFCSSIIHLIAPMVFSNIDAATNTFCYVWDICGAHGLLCKEGYTFCYMDGSPIEYDDAILIERKKIRMPPFVGYRKAVDYLMETIVRK